MKRLLLCMLVFVTVFSQGCCSLFTSGSQQISVESEPAGAKVAIGPYEGVTPYQVSLPRGKSYAIRATHDGKAKTQPLNRGIQGVYWVNILFWPGLIIDVATGKMWTYDPTTYNFDFTAN